MGRKFILKWFIILGKYFIQILGKILKKGLIFKYIYIYISKKI